MSDNENEFIKHVVASEMEDLKDAIELELETTFKHLDIPVQIDIIKFGYKMYAAGKDNMTEYLKEQTDKLEKIINRS